MEKQIFLEVSRIIDQCIDVYHDFGFDNFNIKLALRPKDRIGSDEIWNKAENKLAEVLNSKDIKFERLIGEGAFYGPKIELHLNDSIGRSWQCGTIQLDFSMPSCLNVNYFNEYSEKKEAVIIHRAVIGSFERFIGILIEHYEGKLPIWLSPVQIAIIGISNKEDIYIKELYQQLIKLGIRAEIDLRNEKIGFKIRDHTLKKVPYMIIIGKKEQSLKQVTVRNLDGMNLGVMSIDALISFLFNEIDKKGHII